MYDAQNVTDKFSILKQSVYAWEKNQSGVTCYLSCFASEIFPINRDKDDFEFFSKENMVLLIIYYYISLNFVEIVEKYGKF